MEYRKLPKGNENISVIGVGTSSVASGGEKEMRTALSQAVEAGINYFDLASSEASTFEAFGKELAPVRDKVYYQVHFGAVYFTGNYGWTTDLDEIKRSVDWQLKNLNTDYIDFGFIHCIDEHSDLAADIDNGVIDYIKQLKNQGVIRHIGLSSHSPETACEVLDMGIADMLMFSINPAYDYKHGDYAKGSVAQRNELYRRCEKEGIGISVMKPYSGGQLLDAKTSPFGKSLTTNQCIQYALDKPGVLTVLPGIRNSADLQNTLKFFDAPDEEKDYSVIGSFAPADAKGRCVYCNHCQPCPAGLDVAMINKYYDLTLAGDDMAAGHYMKLETAASDCIACGHCNDRCPFSVDQMARMKEISAHFGR